MGDAQEALILLGFVVVIMTITVLQERRTDNALNALRDLSSPRALALRGGTLVRIAGRDVVREDLLMIAEGDRIPADTALALGLVNRVVPADELMPTTLELAHRIAEVPQQALRQTKRLMNTHLTRALAGLLDDALATERVSVNSADHKELTRALVEAAAARAAQRS